MSQKDIKSRLAKSINAETQAVQRKFENAENVLEESRSNKRQSPTTAKKVIRDSFTFPAEDIELLKELKDRSLKCATNATKSEIVRAGLHALSAMSDKELVKILQEVEKVKTGRPGNR